ncbi:hypothetical protein MHSWG343_10830 [Candidatus Mycoplasma haematohominis]|uniref:Uncharacterized protein n=1 Tax=Candidatus Mycoplasma haematohominis TaxID=1494318 RepID=A0A478FVC4_9MOLU|nr:hypothetical protein MHSWG343_10830 [Candidatus Mycoplasma haemohominis]
MYGSSDETCSLIMTPQVAVGAAAGTAVVGGGGALAAYAAGAFSNSKNANNEKEKTYRSQAEGELVSSKEYIAGDKNNIQNLLKTGATFDSVYQGELDKVWENMNKEGLGTSGNTLTKPAKEDVKKSEKASEVAEYTSKWCEHTSNLKLAVIPSQEGTAEKKTWDAFKAACFNKKATGGN